MLLGHEPEPIPLHWNLGLRLAGGHWASMGARLVASLS
jgi:hypothetical protein